MLDSRSICAFISPESCVLSFDDDNSVALCVGIDEMHSQPYVGKVGPDDIIKEDARDMSAAFINYLGLNRDQVYIRIASDKLGDCTKQALHTSFVECAKKVKENGTFIFYFAGHGKEFRERCVLTTSDFAGFETTGISGDDLVQWLNDAECKASNLLFIFDCCYAGNLGKTLQLDKELSINARLFAICGCLPGEVITTIKPLGHSMFTYFLLDYLKNPNHNCRRAFNIYQASSEIGDFSLVLSSLLYMYEENKISSGGFTPKLYSKEANIQKRGITEQDKHIVSLLRSLLDEVVNKFPNNAVDGWLQSSKTKSSLKILSDKASTCKSLQNCIVCIMLHSSVIFHYEKEDDHGKECLGNKNMFLQIAIKVLNEIDFCELTIDHVMEGLDHYITVVGELKIEESNLNSLYRKIKEIAEEKNVQKPIIPSIGNNIMVTSTSSMATPNIATAASTTLDLDKSLVADSNSHIEQQQSAASMFEGLSVTNNNSVAPSTFNNGTKLTSLFDAKSIQPSTTPNQVANMDDDGVLNDGLSNLQCTEVVARDNRNDGLKFFNVKQSNSSNH